MAARTDAGTGCVLARPSKKHGNVFQIRWRVNGGSARYETVGANRKEAEQALALKLAEINRGTYREHREADFHVFASEWFAGHRARLRPSARERMRNDLEVHLVPFFGEYLVAQIGAELIERYVAEKVEERKAGERRIAELEREIADGGATVTTRARLRDARRERGLSNVSINKTLTLLRQVLAAAVRYGYLDRNPVDDIRRLRVARKSQAFLQLDQIDALVEATDGQHHALLWTLLLAGLRIGEALALRWGDVDLLADPPRLTITRTWDPASKLEGAERRGIEGPVKTGEEGSVAIGPYLLKALLDHKAQSRFAGDDELVFPTSAGHHQNPSNFRRRVLAPAVEEANGHLREQERPVIPAITPHSLRHTFCSLLISDGVDISTVAAQMRHADISTTLRVYTHVMKHRRDGVADRLDEMVFGHRDHPSGRRSVASLRREAATAGDSGRSFRSTEPN